jgi:oxygen-dependent protoporphyrinogen oxidase
MTDVDTDIVVLGGGLAGMTAAYELRDLDPVVLESRHRVGGRTKSIGDSHAWVNAGAQIITSQRVKDLCETLGLDLVSVDGADFGLVVRGRFSRGPSAERLFLGLNLGLGEKADLARTVLRLQRIMHKVAKMSPEERLELDGTDLRSVLGSASPSTVEIINGFCEEATGSRVEDVSALIGLVYSLTAYIDADARKGMYAVRGGTQGIALGLASHLPSGAVRLGCRVTSVRTVDGIAEVDYEQDGEQRTLRARHAVSALPAPVVLDVVTDLPDDVRSALQHRSPYSTLITVTIPVRDGVKSPWDGVFFIPTPGSSARFGLISNYGHLAKIRDPARGGYLALLANGRKGAAAAGQHDQQLIDAFVADLEAIFPGAAALIDRDGAQVQRWDPVGLPSMRPGSYRTRAALRQPIGAVRLCGDYTAEPGLAGANNSGYYVAGAVRSLLVGAS